MWRGTCCRHRPAAPGSADQTGLGTAASLLGSAGLKTSQDGSELAGLAPAEKRIAVVVEETAENQLSRDFEPDQIVVLGCLEQVVLVVPELIGETVGGAEQNWIGETAVCFVVVVTVAVV